MNRSIAARRLLNQGITSEGRRRPSDVVALLGAMQAQEYEPAKWALGLRMQDGTIDAEIEDAFAKGLILRTHVMRPTWHFVTPRDIRWLLELTGPRVQRVMSSYNRKLEFDAKTMARGLDVIERALGGGKYLTRTELGDCLRRAKLVVDGIRLAQVAMHAEIEGVICSGPRRGKQFTYALLAERAPAARRLERDEALGELARRYFGSHGPATVRDFVWWSGLTTADAKRGLEIGRAQREEIDGRTYWSLESKASDGGRDRVAHLLPIYDEYLVAYKDREAVPHGAGLMTTANAWVTFQHALVIGGQVAGTWRLPRGAGGMSIEATTLRRLTERERRALADAAREYCRFRGVPMPLKIQAGRLETEPSAR
jgi:hypothetical protein